MTITREQVPYCVIDAYQHELPDAPVTHGGGTYRDRVMGYSERSLAAALTMWERHKADAHHAPEAPHEHGWQLLAVQHVTATLPSVVIAFGGIQQRTLLLDGCECGEQRVRELRGHWSRADLDMRPEMAEAERNGTLERRAEKGWGDE